MYTNINKDYQEINLKLVAEVEKRPALYNFKLPDFSRKSVTDRLWQEVADEMDKPVIEVKEKWRNLRSVYMRKLKKESEGGKKKVYYLENAIKFCLPFIKMYNTSENQTPSTSPNTPTVSQTTGTPPAQTKDQPVGLTLPAQAKKLFILRNNRPADTDHEYVAKQVLKPKKAKTLADEVASSSNIIDRQQSIKMFLLSLIPELEELSDYQIKLFKRRVFYIIDEVSNTKE